MSTIGDNGVYVVRQKRAKESVHLAWRPIAGALSYKLEMRTALPLALDEITELAGLIDRNSSAKADDAEHGIFAAVAICYSSPGIAINGCRCHSSCASCGYSSLPTDAEHCVTCANNSTVEQIREDGTGRCPDAPARQSRRAAAGPGSFDVLLFPGTG